MKLSSICKSFFCVFVSIFFFAAGLAAAEVNPLAPVKTDNPRDTMMTFMESMKKYKEGVEKGDRVLMGQIDRAVRCFDLEQTSFLEYQQKGRESAILLKEVIDRVIVIDYEKIPVKSDIPGEKLLRWRLKGTEITITLQKEGDRAGEYLFSRDTSHRVREFYDKVKHLPYLAGSGGGAMYSDTWFEENVPEWMRQKIFLLYIWQWAAIFIIILSGFIIKLFVKLFVDTIKRISEKSKGIWLKKIASAFSGPTSWMSAAVFWFLTIRMLGLEGFTLTLVTVLIKISLSAIFLWLVYRLLNVLSDYFLELAKKTPSTLDDQLVPILTKTMRIFVIIFGSLVAVQNIGINVMSVLAGLGIGGLAFALAARDMVANFFGSLMILFDGPFQVGDWIIAGKSEGTVEEIGFRSTKIRTFYNSVISIPNADLATNAVDNMGKREYRRIRTVLGITYDTPPEKFEAFLEGIKNIIKANPYTRKDYFHVVFNGYGDSSLEILLYAFLKVPDWSTELVEKQNIFMEILRLASELGIDFAFPTQSLHIETFPEKERVRKPWQKDVDAVREKAKRFGPGEDLSKPAGLGIYTPSFREK
ncbi:MAG TPA: mechanosensitive ion channel family protein [Spirochaetota bacterium]|nr:mechanosensitive ion channel family protein [Spirochaetota bacterium]